MCFWRTFRIWSLRSISDSCLNSLTSHYRSLADSAFSKICLFATVFNWVRKSCFFCIRCINSCSFYRIFFRSA
jgi:hypothetical protein